MITINAIKEKAARKGVSSNLILKETIHLIILDYLFQKGAFSSLVFQGDTALRIAYKGVRYSEDLDFVLKKKDLSFHKSLPAILAGLPSYLDKRLPFAKTIQLKIQKHTDSFARFALTMGIEELKTQDKTSIEIAHVPSYEHETLLIRSEDLLVHPAIRVESPKEILSDKLTAFGARNYVKGRDIWDIYFLLHTLNVSMDPTITNWVRKKIRDYHSTLHAFLVGFKRNRLVLSKNGLSILMTEMDQFLPVSYRNMFREQYKSISESVLETVTKFHGELQKDEA